MTWQFELRIARMEITLLWISKSLPQEISEDVTCQPQKNGTLIYISQDGRFCLLFLSGLKSKGFDLIPQGAGCGWTLPCRLRQVRRMYMSKHLLSMWWSVGLAVYQPPKKQSKLVVHIMWCFWFKDWIPKKMTAMKFHALKAADVRFIFNWQDALRCVSFGSLVEFYATTSAINFNIPVGGVVDHWYPQPKQFASRWHHTEVPYSGQN